MSHMVIAVDGPAAAGKGTLARNLARRFGLAYLDSGALYRAAALRLLRAGGDGSDVAAAEAAARAVEPGDLDDAMLREPATGTMASRVAEMPEVRAALIDYQRRFAAEPPHGARGVVIDGRDIGTVVCPDASHKLFVTASLETRVGRRLEELREKGIQITAADVEREIRERDERDHMRSVSPLVPAPDAYLLDTTNLDIDSAFAGAEAYISARAL